MPKYNVEISKIAFKALNKLPNKIAEKIEIALLKLEENSRPAGSKQLSGFKDLYRLRIGIIGLFILLKRKLSQLLYLMLDIGKKFIINLKEVIAPFNNTQNAKTIITNPTTQLTDF